MQVSVGNQTKRSRLAPLQGGRAKWGQDFAFAVVLPLRTRPLRLELHHSSSNRRKGRTLARAFIPLATLFPEGSTESVPPIFAPFPTQNAMSGLLTQSALLLPVKLQHACPRVWLCVWIHIAVARLHHAAGPRISCQRISKNSETRELSNRFVSIHPHDSLRCCCSWERRGVVPAARGRFQRLWGRRGAGRRLRRHRLPTWALWPAHCCAPRAAPDQARTPHLGPLYSSS